MPTSGSASSTLETPVLVIGAGPTGLALAADLGLRGAPCILVEQSPSDAAEPGASLLDVRSMEWLRRVGLADAVKASALPDEICARLYCTSLSSYEIARLDLASPPSPASPERSLRINQLWLAPLLRELAASHRDTRLRYRWRLDSLKQRGDCILAELSDLAALERRRIAAQYVVDCTGASSQIRAAHGLTIEPPADSECFAQLHLRIPGLPRLHDKRPAAETVFVDAKGMWRSLDSLDGRDLYRLRLDGEAQWQSHEAIDATRTLEEIAGQPVTFQLLSRGRWRAGNAVATNWREGNIVLAGDAAHQTTPSSEAGLSLGLADAADLAWKLEARLTGWGASGIVDAYEAERKPLLRQLVGSLNEERQHAREDRPFELHADIALDTLAGRAARKALGAQLEARHVPGRTIDFSSHTLESSPIIASERDRGAIPALLGARAPYARLPGGISTLDLHGRGYVLLRLGARVPEPGGLDRAFAHRGVPLSFRSFDDPALAAQHGARLVLVRPDGRVAWCGDEPPTNPLALADRVRGAAVSGLARV